MSKVFSAVVGSLFLFAAGSASALSVNVIDLGAGNATPVAFANADDKSDTGVFEGVTGSIDRQRRSPWEGTSFYTDGVYSSVSGGRFAMYHVDASRSLDLVWGSPDSHNKLSFFSGTTLLGSITGQQVLDDVKSISTAPGSNPSQGFAFLRLALDGNAIFDKLTFESGSNAFEYGGVAVAPVPLPAGVWLLLSGVASLGFARRRARTA